MLTWNRQRETLRLIGETLPRGSSIIDIAAAQGNFSLILAERGYHVTWNDLRAELADYVRQKHEYGDLTYAPGNAFELIFPELFDCVLFCEIIEHVAHPDQFLEKVTRLLKPGGMAVMTTPNGGFFGNKLPRFSDCSDPSQYETVQFKPNSDGHIFLLWPEEVIFLAQRAGLVVEKCIFFTTPLSNGYLKTQSLLRIMPKKTVDALENFCRRLPPFVQKRLMIQTAARFRKPGN